MYTCLVGCTLVWGGGRCHSCANTFLASEAAQVTASLRGLDWKYENHVNHPAKKEASRQRKAIIRRPNLNMQEAR